MRDRSGSGQSSGNSGFVHEDATSGIRLCMDFGVVDRIASEALRGLSALPRRGMEVGGLLLGTVDTTGRPVQVFVEDCVAFPSEHLYGPNFVLSPKDREEFTRLVASWAPAPGRPLHHVGFYRSHTRGGLELTPEDIELLDEWMPAPYAVCLLIRPYATRPSEAAVYFRHQGSFQAGPAAITFPFRRRELGGGPRSRRQAGAGESAANESPARTEAHEAPVETWIQSRQETEAAHRTWSGWLLATAMLAFLLLGIVIGVQTARVLEQRAAPAPQADPYALGLSAVQIGDEIHLRWNPQAPAIAACRSASLVIRDGPTTRIIDLRKSDLARAALIYRHTTPEVSFRMEVLLSPGNTVTETLDLRLMPEESRPPEPTQTVPVK